MSEMTGVLEDQDPPGQPGLGQKDSEESDKEPAKLLATPVTDPHAQPQDPSTNKLAQKLVGQVEGKATLCLMTPGLKDPPPPPTLIPTWYGVWKGRTPADTGVYDSFQEVQQVTAGVLGAIF